MIDIVYTMNSFTIGRVQSLPVSTTTDNQCAFSDTFTTLRARGLSQHPADTATSVVSIDSNGVIAVGGSAGAINLLTEAGQLLTSNRTEAVALDVGTTGQVLTANSSAADGIKWANLPAATPTLLGVMYGSPPVLTNSTSSLSLGANAIASGMWSIAIGNNVLTKADSSTIGNVAVGSLNLQNATTGQNNVAIGQGQW